RCVFTSARLGEWRRKRISEYEHDHFEDSHDCSRVARGWNFAGDGSERSSDWRPTAGGWRRWWVSGLWVRLRLPSPTLWLRRTSIRLRSYGSALRLRGSSIRLRSGGTGDRWIDRYYRDARSGLHSATGGVRVL